MSKAILEFTLPDEEPEFRLAADAGKMWSALWHFREETRRLKKYERFPSAEALWEALDAAWAESTDGIDWEGIP